jgi:polyisoprenoid-binding protein YceI
MAKLPGRPRSKRGIVLAICAALVAVAIAIGAVVYFVVFPSSSPKPFRLARSPTTTTQTTAPTGLAGRWQIAAGSQAGYRVREQLAFLPAPSDAVGRTSAVTGTANLTDARNAVTITSASFNVAVNTLKSDRSLRDEKLHQIGIESDRYPSATFHLSTPVKLPARALTGTPAPVSAAGALNLHGVSRQVTIPLEVAVSGATLEAAGSLTFPWSAFAMTAPSIGGFVTVTDMATMEFDLRLQRA